MTGTTVAGTEGSSQLFGVATISGLSDQQGANYYGNFSAVIDWGDGSSGTTGELGSGFVQSGHAYADEGHYTVSVTLYDLGAPYSSVESTANISDAPLQDDHYKLPPGVQAGSPLPTYLNGYPGYAAIAAFYDGTNPDSSANDFSATIDWGDGAITDGTVVVFDNPNYYGVLGSHIYTTVGTYPINVEITDEGGSKLATVNEADVLPSSTGAGGIPTTQVDPTSLSWNALANGGGFTFTYQVDNPSGDPIPDTTLDFYWQSATGPAPLAYQFALGAGAVDFDKKPAYEGGPHKVVETQHDLILQATDSPELGESTSPPDAAPGNLSGSLGQTPDALVAKVVVQGEPAGNDITLNAVPLVVDVVSPGFNLLQNPLQIGQPSFLAPFVQLATDMQNIPAAASAIDNLHPLGSTLYNRVASYVPTWDSASSFRPGFLALMASYIATADSELAAKDGNAALASLYANTASLFASYAASTASASDQRLLGAAWAIVQDLTNPANHLLLPPKQSNDLQVINLDGHSRGAELNAVIARILTAEGYTNIADFVALDGYSSDWSRQTPGGGVLTNFDLGSLRQLVPVTNAAFNLRADQGLADDAMVAKYVYPLLSPTTIMQLQADTDLRAPAREGVGFQDSTILGTTHTNITPTFDQNLSQLFGNEGYLYQNQQAGLESTDGSSAVTNLASESSPLGRAVTAQSLSDSATDTSGLSQSGFLDGDFAALSALDAHDQAASTLTTGDPTIDAELQSITTQLNAIDVYWTTTGDVTLVHPSGNPALQLDDSSGGGASVGQSIVLPQLTQSVDFDLNVINASPGDSLKVLMNGNLLQSIDLAGLSSAHESVPVPTGSGPTATFTFQLLGSVVPSATITLGNIGIGILPNQAPTVLRNPVALPTIVDTIAASANLGVAVSNFQNDLSSAHGTDTARLGIAIVGVDSADGTVQYSSDGGASWANVGAVTDANALVLSPDSRNRLRFVPNSAFDGTISSVVSFRAWDPVVTGIGVLSGAFVDVSSNGGATAFSANVDSASLVVQTPHQDYVTAVYSDVLSRAPDPGGLAYWSQQLDAGMPVSSVAEAIAHSDEYYGNFVIKPDYLKLLGRAADDAGVKYWTQQMDAGLTDQQLEAGFAASDEFFANAGGKANPVNWIDAIYKLLLGRAADTAGEQYWSGQLQQGQTRLQVAEGVAGSQENNTQLINDDYFHYLGRAADPSGLAFWLQQFADGKTNEDVIAGFTGSAEYYKEHTN